MYILEVLPLSVLPPQVPQILSYYHDTSLPKGSAVEVSLNNRSVSAVVIDSYDLDEQKIIVKKSLFQLKKVTKVLSPQSVVAEWQFKIALWLASQYIAPLGLCLKTVLPPFFLKNRYPIEPANLFINSNSEIVPQWIIARAKDSASQFKSKKLNLTTGQTLIVVPDTSYIPFFQKEFSNLGPSVLTAATGIKEYYRIWKEVSVNKKGVIVGTRQALFLPFTNLKNLIVIDPLHEFYKSDMSPKYWTPELAEMIAMNHGAHLFALSPLLGVTAYKKLDKGQIEVTDEMKPWTSKLSTIDLTAEFKQGYVVGILTPDARDVMRETLSKKGKVLIVSARRGYNGILICQKCSYSFKCPDCDLPMRIHQGTTLILMCHHCNRNQPYPQSCPNCHSSQIKPTGPAGSQKIFEELQKMITFGQLDRLPILIMDADVSQNQTEEDEIINEINKPGPTILIATQKIFSYGYELKFNTIIIPQLDALAVGSDFQTTERLWYHMEKLGDFEPAQIVAQTFNQKDLLSNLARHHYAHLYDLELSARESFWYPPFCRIIKLTYTHADHRTVITSARAVIEKLKMASIHIKAQDKVKITDTSHLFLKKERGRFTYTIIIKTALDFPPRDLLRYVPTQWLIDVDPRTTT
jgi:primosomal protein N' (replication factor Y)